MLLLRWEEDDLGTQAELDALDEVFRTKFNYETEQALIPSRGGQMSLNLTASKFVSRHSDELHLLIIYYGGHGVARKDNKSVWAAYVLLSYVQQCHVTYRE